jgi:hypothetical protein
MVSHAPLKQKEVRVNSGRKKLRLNRIEMHGAIGVRKQIFF